MYENMLQNVGEIIERDRDEILNEWVADLKEYAITISGSEEGELRSNCKQFLTELSQMLKKGTGVDIDSQGWNDTRQLLTEISRARAKEGSTPTETAMFIFALKQSLFRRMEEVMAGGSGLASAIWSVSRLLDKLGLHTMEVFQRSREQIIERQQQELLELSTPVVKLWHNILALPLIGTLDSARTQVVMENLLQKVIETGSEIAIIDISGVPMVDTLVAQHLLKTVAATRLMGADCIISGIRPQIAQTIVQLGVNLEDVVTKATLADAFVVALERTGAQIAKPEMSS